MQRARGASAFDRHVGRRRRRRTAVFSALLDARRPAHGAAMLNIEGSSFLYLRRGWYFALAAWRPLAASVNASTCTSYAPSRWHLSLNAHRTSHVQLGITHFDPFLPAAQIPPLHMHPSPPQASLNSARRMHRPIMLSGMMRDSQFLVPEPPTRRRQPDRVGPEVDGGVDPWAPITSVHKGPRQAQRR